MATPRKYTKAISGMVILAFLLACAAIGVSWYITNSTYKRMLGNVNQLADPNPRLQLVNSIFRSVVHLDQLQRTYALQPGINSNPYNDESKQVQAMLDTLAQLTDPDDTLQHHRINAMKLLLLQRDQLFTDYLGLTKAYQKNDTLSQQIKTLSTLVNTAARIDSSVITTEQKVTTTTTTIDSASENGEGQRQSFWDRLTGRRRTSQARQVQRLIREELNIKIDTLALATEDSMFREISMAISNVEQDRNSRRATIINRQKQLTGAGNLLISQVLSILDDLEANELQVVAQNNSIAIATANAGLQKMKFIMIIFIIGAAVLLLFIFNNIRRSSTYRKQLVLAKDEAEQLGQVKQRFLANMSHEIRTPLQVIVGIAEQMHMKQQSAPKDIEVVYRSSQHLLQIVNEVLDYSRIVSGKFRFEYQPFDIEALLAEVHDAIALQASNKDLAFSLNTDIASNARYYWGDAFRLKQILYNLLGNAIKFTERGEVSLTVSQTVSNRSASFLFTVQDTGSGISETDLDRIFNQFEQADESLHPQYGTGLGLSIVRELVAAQGGKIDVSSKPGQGSVFTVMLVFQKAEPDQIKKPAASVAITAQNVGLVWVIDDDPLILQICATIFRKHNIPYACYQGSTAALAATTPAGLSTIFMDIRMPGIDGYELCALLRSRIAPAVRIIAFTAQVLPEETDRMLTQGFDALLTKPFMEAELLQLLYKNVGTAPATYTSMFASVKQLSGDDPELLRNLFGSFVNETRLDLSALSSSMNAREPIEVAETLHRIAGRFGQFGLTALAIELRNAERNFRSMPYDEAETLQSTPILASISNATDAAAAYLHNLQSGDA